jgi:hypothetical protein
MSNYDFSTLSPSEFEVLVCDLLNSQFREENNVGNFQSFKEGKDGGIDLLYSTPLNDFKIVVQIKHYLKTTFAKLKNDLVKNEKPKVDKINPEAYIFVTSQELSVANKIDIKEIFSPHIKSLEDIYGKEDLNSLLRRFPVVQENHYKLWFSSVTVFQKILNYKFEGRSNEFDDENFRRKVRLFVLTKDFVNAKSVLEINKFIIITGEPGVGKTFHSEMLIYNYIKEDYELTVIYDDIKEIELKLRNDNSKQIFYFDDFLGHTQAEINKSKSAETSLIKIVNRIEKLENKYLILNTRKFILNTFIEESERFRNFSPLRSESKIELNSYSLGIKYKILRNHLFESELKVEQINEIKNKEDFICNHNNFTPRLVEFFTNKLLIGEFDTKQIKDFIFENLENPKRIWEHAYLQQISDYDRLLLNTLYSLGGNSDYKKLEKAYNSRLDFEVKNNNFIKPINSFKESLKRLNDGFIQINNGWYNNISFINPSLEDFLNYLIKENQSEIERILFSASFLDQWFFFYKPIISNGNIISEKLIEYFHLNNKEYFGINKEEDLILSAIFIYSYKKDTNRSIALINSILDWSFILDNANTRIYLIKFINNSKSNLDINNCISRLSNKLFYNLIISTDDLYDIIDLVLLFKNHYGYSYIDFNEKPKKNKDTDEIIQELYSHLEDIFRYEVENKYNFLMNSKDIEDAESIIYELNKNHALINENLFPEFKIDFSYLTNYNWESVAINNSIEKKHLYEDDFDNNSQEDFEYIKEENYNRGIYYYDLNTDDLPF